MPGVTLLDGPSPALDSYLHALGWMSARATVVAVEPAGEGNMNLVRRLRLDTGGSLVLKHARPWVEKYPQIAAPPQRTLVEGAFYASIRDHAAVAGRMPRLIGLDRDARVLALEDCGGRDCTDLYQGATLQEEDVEAVADYLRALHAVPLDAPTRTALANHEMRALNHAHVFEIPLQVGNGVDLDAIGPGLARAARDLRADRRFTGRVDALGARYRAADGPALLHGDCFPGSWLRTPRGLVVIDPEFCFPGPPAFDLGVCAAHLRLAAQPAAIGRHLLTHYGAGTGALDLDEVSAWAGVEIMRRLLGVAQLPLAAEPTRRLALLDEARALVVGDATLEAA